MDIEDVVAAFGYIFDDEVSVGAADAGGVLIDHSGELSGSANDRKPGGVADVAFDASAFGRVLGEADKCDDCYEREASEESAHGHKFIASLTEFTLKKMVSSGLGRRFRPEAIGEFGGSADLG